MTARNTRLENLEIVLGDWLEALWRRDIEAVEACLDPCVVWQGLREGLVCQGREEVLQTLRSQLRRGHGIEAVELIAAGDHVIVGVCSAALQEIAGVQLGGRIFSVFTLCDGKIVRIRDYARREQALTAADAADRWRPADPAPPVGRSGLVGDLRRLGVRAGEVLMVHASMSALGWVVGGSETVVRALLEALGPDGTLMAYASWEDHYYHVAELGAGERQAAYLAEPPVFDLATAEAARHHGRIPERVRTWPGARRSSHPEANVVAVGARADWLTATHSDEDAYGRATPFARLVEAHGRVVLLGAPLDTITLLHHAEAIANVPDKRRVSFRVSVADRDHVEERQFTDIDTSTGAFPYEQLSLDEDAFAVIAKAALAVGIGVRGRIGAAESHLFPARELTAFAVSWMEERFGASPARNS